RELEAFTQFGSDLDQSTQAKLNRGRRTVEVLKQNLHEPLVIAKQVLILYALIHGFLDTIPVNQILDFEKELFDYFDANHAEIFAEINETKNLPAAEKLDEPIKKFVENFMAEKQNGSLRDSVRNL